MDPNSSPSPSLWDWSEILDFALEDQQLPLPFDLPQFPPNFSPTQAKSERIRKRDPRLTCSNFLAGRIPCACPELDAKLQEEEEAAGPGKKRARTARAGPGTARCQVPQCGTDISELKGYHRRHRVCLGCANAREVVLDGENKRYCQQCGKFHILSDFDEGKRSCRRKLQRHNNRRRRKPSDSKDAVEREPQQELLAEDTVCGDDIDGKSLSSQGAQGGTWLDTEEQTPILPSAHVSQNIQCDSGVSLAASDETLNDEERETYTRSPSYNDNKNSLFSVCPTGRISFKLYDWNPAEFPRRLRHQIFQWLASMPVELEGYIRPGCTILTMFIAMPKFMWVKLLEDPVAHIHNLMVAPGNMLSGRGTFFVYLNNMIYRVMKDGTSVMKVDVEREAPKLHYVYPTCFEAGKPMEFVACGSNLLQPKLRFLVSFAGKYLRYVVCVPSPCSKTEKDAASSFNHQLVKIYVPHTEPDVFGPAFIEVENDYGLSNFIPILIGDKEICSEIKIMQHKFDKYQVSKESKVAATSSSFELFVLRQKYLSELILDVAWLFKEPSPVDMQNIPVSFQIQRFNYILEVLVENESTAMLQRALKYMKIVMDNCLTTGIADADMRVYQRNINQVTDILGQKLPQKDVEASKFDASEGFIFRERSTTVPLLNREVFMSIKEGQQPKKPHSRVLFTKSVFTSRPLIFVIATATVCFGICAAVLHPDNVGKFATTIRRCMFDNT
ncbi:hypothetical protein LguiB_025720 [Lonicera macranthoides]